MPVYDAEQLSNDMELSNLFLNLCKETLNYKAAANWITGPLKNYLSVKELSFEDIDLNLSSLARLIELTSQGKINHGTAVQKIFPALLNDPSLDVLWFIEQNDLFVQSSKSEIEAMIETALNRHPQKIKEYKKGKKGLISLFVGEVMKLSKGKADAKLVTEKIIEKLKV